MKGLFSLLTRITVLTFLSLYRPYIKIDGELHAPLAYTAYFEECAEYSDFIKSGYRMFFVNVSFTDLPIKAMVANVREAGIPASVSNTAGTFVCNHLMYGVLYLAAMKYPGLRGGFIHVPFIPSQVVNRPTPAPCLSVEMIAQGLEACIRAIDETEEDLKVAEGKNF